MTLPLNRGNDGNSGRCLSCTKISKCWDSANDKDCQKHSPPISVAPFEYSGVSFFTEHLPQSQRERGRQSETMISGVVLL